MGLAAVESGDSPDTINILWLDWGDGDGAAMRIFAEQHVNILRIQSSLKALERIDRAEVAGAVFDLDGADDIGVVPRFKALAPDVPVVLLRSSLTQSLTLWALRLGVRDAVEKPLEAAETARVTAELRRLVALRRAGQSRRELLPRHIPPPDGLDFGRERRGGRDRRIAAGVESYVERHLQEPMRVADIASACGTTAAGCTCAFKKHFGRTIQSHILQTRVRHAATLLQDTGLAVSEVGWRVGFRDPAYFARVFRQVVGICPMEFRRLSRHAGSDGTESPDSHRPQQLSPSGREAS